MTQWVVSGHAAVCRTLPKGTSGGEAARRWENIKVPAGVEIYFFVDEGAGLPVDKGWKIYHRLMMRNKTPGDLDFIFTPAISGIRQHKGSIVPNYWIWGDKKWTDPQNGQCASGIFVAGDEFHQDPRRFYIYPNSPQCPHNLYGLKNFFYDGSVTWQPGDQVFWVACRSWHASGTPPR
jgi:hypothetical protein